MANNRELGQPSDSILIWNLFPLRQVWGKRFGGKLTSVTDLLIPEFTPLVKQKVILGDQELKAKKGLSRSV